MTTDNLSNAPGRPPVKEAMGLLIQEIRKAMPLDQPVSEWCSDNCNACSVKLLEYLSSELDNWESRIEAGENPGLKEYSRLANSARKIHRVLKKNGIIND